MMPKQPRTKAEVEKLFKSLSEMPSDFYFEERVDELPREREEP